MAHRFDGRIVAVDVGKQVFHVCEDLLISHSDFFSAAFVKKEGSDEEDGFVRLKDTSVASFKIFQQFLYAGSIYTADEDDSRAERSTNDEYDRIVNCWKLSDRVASISFKDAVVDTLIAKMMNEDFNKLGLHEKVYPASHADSKIRKLLIDIALYRWEEKDYGDWKMVRDQPEFFSDIMTALRRKWVEGLPIEWTLPFEHENTCAYHEHISEYKSCYKTTF